MKRFILTLLAVALLVIPADASRRFNTDYTTECALGNVTGCTTWSKFGYNEDVDTKAELIAVFGGSFNQCLASVENLD